LTKELTLNVKLPYTLF